MHSDKAFLNYDFAVFYVKNGYVNRSLPFFLSSGVVMIIKAVLVETVVRAFASDVTAVAETLKMNDQNSLTYCKLRKIIDNLRERRIPLIP